MKGWRLSYHAAFMSDCTLGQGSGARLRNGAQSMFVIRSMTAVLTEGRSRTRAHQSAIAAYRIDVVIVLEHDALPTGFYRPRNLVLSPAGVE